MGGGGSTNWRRKIGFCDMVTTDVTTTGQAIIQVIDITIRFKIPSALTISGIPKEHPRQKGIIQPKSLYLYQGTFIWNIRTVAWPTYLLNSRMARVEVGIVPSAQERKWNWVT